MIRQDYIMRMIEQLVKVLAKILLNKEVGDYNAAFNNIDDALSTIVGFDYNMINQLSTKDVISLLEISKDNSAVTVKCIVIAKLLKEKADLLRQKDNDNKTIIYDYEKALALFLHSILSNKNAEIDIANYYPDVKEIVKNILDEMPIETRFGLFKFYELIGEFDRAEDELFKLKNLHYPKIEEEGIKFFRSLEKLSNNELLNGNLSKEEVEQGLLDFINDAT
jgi:hypothetical protein